MNLRHATIVLGHNMLYVLQLNINVCIFISVNYKERCCSTLYHKMFTTVVFMLYFTNSAEGHGKSNLSFLKSYCKAVNTIIYSSSFSIITSADLNLVFKDILRENTLRKTDIGSKDYIL